MGPKQAKGRVVKYPDIPREFSGENYTRLVDLVSTALRTITLDNFAAQVIENITLPAGLSVKISHNLKSVPKYRIILRQDDANSLITDSVDQWTGEYITLKNQGAVDTTISIAILRG